MLCGWIITHAMLGGQYKQELRGITPLANALTLEQPRIPALEAESRQPKRDNDLLKRLLSIQSVNVLA